MELERDRFPPRTSNIGKTRCIVADLAPKPEPIADPGQVRAQMERILSSRTFASAPSIARLLRFIVEETLSGRSDGLKEYTLGVQIFDRGEQYDTRLDPIVRVQARNLRLKLDRYYSDAGVADAILIELPKGCYIPTFRTREPEPVRPLLVTLPVPGPVLLSAPAPLPAPEVAAVIAIGTPSARFRLPVWLGATVCLVLLLAGGSLTLWRARGAPLATELAKAPPETTGSDARSLYLRGRYLLDRASETTLTQALECFRKALALEPRNAAAWSGLADVYDVQAQFGLISPVRGMAEARSAAQKALQLDPSLAEAHISIAAIYEAYDWNWKAAEREYRRAIELNPQLPSAHLWYGMFLRDQGRLREAMPYLERALRLEPLSVFALCNIAEAYAMQRDYTSAIRNMDVALELAPQSRKLQMMRAGLKREHSGEQTQWINELERARNLNTDDPASTAALARAYAKSGRKADAARLLEELRRIARERYVSPYQIAMVYLALNDLDRALPYLEAAYRERNTGLLFLRSDHFAGYRSNPRFRQLVERMHFEG